MFRSVNRYRQLFFNSFNRKNSDYKIHSGPDFTKNKYNVKRGNYSTLEEKHITFFNKLLGERRVLTDVSILEPYNVDWFQHVRGNSSIVLKPKTTKEVSQILSFCNDNRLAVCPQGGNTSVSGASVPVFDEIIINTDLMNDVISLDNVSGVLVCQAGCILENLNNYLSNENLIVPLDLGSKESCHIGGNISTNAGGQRFFRYGSLHGNVLGIEVVTANGEIIDFLSMLRKDNTGYHLKHLFIGSEGTLGFITKVALQCQTLYKNVTVSFLGLQSYEKVLKTFKQAKEDLGEILSAIELIDNQSMQLVIEKLKLNSPIGDYPFYLLLETMGSNEEHDMDKLNKFLNVSLMKHFVLNGMVTSDPSKCQAIWSIRERISEATLLDGYVFNYDFSLPLQCYYQLVTEMREYMGHRSHRVFGFGHLGDGNIHLNISVKEYTTSLKNYIEPFIYNRVKALNGSISAEHGLGFLKAPYLHLMKGDSNIQLMKKFKTIIDPNGILNPYKVLPWI